MKLRMLLSIVIPAGCMLASAANAATLTYSTTSVPADVYTAPDSTTGPVLLAQTGTSTNNYVSPFSDNTSPYVSVEGGGSATYNLSGNSLSFVFGTPDPYNQITFLNTTSGFSDVFTIAGTSLSNLNNYFVTIRAAGDFDRVVFSSSINALEFSNVSVATVPLPAAAPMFGAALLVLGAVGYGLSRKRPVAAV